MSPMQVDVREIASRLVGDLSAFGNTHMLVASETHSSGAQNEQGNTRYAARKRVEETILDILKPFESTNPPMLGEAVIRRAASLKSSGGRTLLHVSAAGGLHRLLQKLLLRGVNPDVRDDNGYAPLHFAAMYGKIESAMILIERGADARSLTLTGISAREIARLSAQLGTQQFLDSASDARKVRLALDNHPSVESFSNSTVADGRGPNLISTSYLAPLTSKPTKTGDAKRDTAPSTSESFTASRKKPPILSATSSLLLDALDFAGSAVPVVRYTSHPQVSSDSDPICLSALHTTLRELRRLYASRTAADTQMRDLLTRIRGTLDVYQVCQTALADDPCGSCAHIPLYRPIHFHLSGPPC